MRMTPESGSPIDRGTTIEIEAAENLKEGQNFFDQEPFRGIGQSIVAETQLERESVLWYLGSFSRNNVGHSSFDETSRLKTLRSWKGWIAVREKERVRRFANKFKIDPSKGIDLAAKIIFSFHEYPYMIEYVGENLNESLYALDGTYSPVSFDLPDFPKTYPNWLTQKLKRKHDSISWGIQEVFPKESVISNVGEKKENRRWRILKASELVRPR